MNYNEVKITAEYACTSYDYILPYWTWFTGEQFATEIEARFADSPRTRAVIDAVRSLVCKIYRTPAGVKYAIKKRFSNGIRRTNG